ncbi:MAG: DUF1127 domain-containing protein [Aestuariivirga sp.]
MTRHLKERAAMRRLRRLDDRMLADIGLHRSQIRSAVKYQTSGNPL